MSDKVNSGLYNNVCVHNMGVSDSQGKIKISNNNGMSRISEGESGNLTEVTAITLDDFSKNITEGKISLLKVDTEGHELEALVGASKLLSSQSIDMIYIEAGMNRDNKQQTYYREIEDLLNKNGYKLFRIYEQMFEWMDDSPALRRVNLAFISNSFLKENPFRLANEIFEKSEELIKIKKTKAELDKIIINLNKDNQIQEKKFNLELSGLNKDISIYKDNNTRYIDLQNDSKSMGVDNKNLNNEVVRLNAKIIKSLEESNKDKVSIGILENKIAFLKTQEIKIAENKEKLKADITNLKTQEINISADNEKLKDEISSLKSHEINKSADNEKLKDEISSLKTQEINKSADNEKLKDEISSLKTQEINISADNERLKGDISNLKWLGDKQITDIDKKNKSLEKSLLSNNDSLGQLTQKVIDLEGSLTQAAVVISNKDEIISNKDVEYKKTHSTFNNLIKDLEDTKENLEKKVKTLYSLSEGSIKNIEDLGFENNQLLNKIDRIHNYLTYKIGAAIVTNSNSLIGFLKIPYSIYKAKKEFNSRGKITATDHSQHQSNIDAMKKRLNVIKSTTVFKKAPGIDSNVDPIIDQFYAFPKPNKIAIIKQAHLGMLSGDISGGISFAEKNATDGQISSIELLKANANLGDDKEWLKHINKYLEKFDVDPISLSTSNKPRFFNISNKRKSSVNGGPLVSILIPAFNSEKTIELSVYSILNQTWSNLEVIIVDDCSTDKTWEILKKISADEPRIKLLKNKVNVGPYVSKNIALQQATGDYITGHDADDISLSRRIENHISFMLKNPKVKASTNNKIRIKSDGQIVNFTAVRGKEEDGASGKAFISCMFERDFLVNRLGYWDSVRFGADGEIIGRAKIILKENFKELPLLSMFCLDDENSLTNNSVNGISKTTGLSPSRRFYLENYKKWHATLKTSNCYLGFPPESRFFDVMDASMVPFGSIEANLK